METGMLEERSWENIATEFQIKLYLNIYCVEMLLCFYSWISIMKIHVKLEIWPA